MAAEGGTSGACRVCRAPIRGFARLRPAPVCARPRPSPACVRGMGVAKEKPPPCGRGFWDKAPGDDLLLHGWCHSTIGAAAFHFRVRDGIGWFHSAMVAREGVEGRACARRLTWGGK